MHYFLLHFRFNRFHYLGLHWIEKRKHSVNFDYDSHHYSSCLDYETWLHPHYLNFNYNLMERAHSFILSQIYDGKEQAELKGWHLVFRLIDLQSEYG